MLRVRWLGRVRYQDAYALQRALFERSPDDHLLLLEHEHVFTLGVRADLANLLVRPADVRADLVKTDRGGDITYHGPGQLTGYPILTVPGKRGGGMGDTVAYVRAVEDLVIESLADLGLPGTGRLDGYPGVWVDPGSDHPRKICAVGVKLSRARTMHGFALNVDPDMRYFDFMVPCGIADKAVTSIAAEGIEASMRDVVDALTARAVDRWGTANWERQDVVWRHRPDDLSPFSRGEGPGETVRLRGRLAEAGVTEGLQITERKPPWLRAKARMGADYLRLKSTMRDLSLVTVCEEAGCPNIFECWSDGTATFMINGERCTRACGFCLVDTRHPLPIEADEPERVAEAVARMGLEFAVVTAVARDDVPDGGAGAFADTIRAIRRRNPRTQVEVLIPDCKGDAPQRRDRAPPPAGGAAVGVVCEEPGRPRPGGRRRPHHQVGVDRRDGGDRGRGPRHPRRPRRDRGRDRHDGQYLRPTTHHLPVARWWTPDEFDRLKAAGEALGIGHVEASPLTRSSYHAKQAAATLGASDPALSQPVS
jgi:lipoic acid synthetase